MAAEQTTTVLNAALRRSHPRRSDHSRLPWNRLDTDHFTQDHTPFLAEPRHRDLPPLQYGGPAPWAHLRTDLKGPPGSWLPVGLAAAPLESTLQPPSLALAVTPGALRKEAAAGESAQKWLPGEQNR